MKYICLLLCVVSCLINTKSFAQTPTDTTQEVITMAEVMPQFPGGEEEMYDFINKNLLYPKLAKENGIEGRVIVRFIVQKSGYIDKIEIIRKLGWGCDEEVLRMVQLMPKWSPGKVNGKPVAVYFTLPVTFKLK